MTDSHFQHLPIGNVSFSDIRRRNLLYVDKTAMIAELAGFHQSFFLVRPPGFGRTLLLSAFESLFSQGASAFRGLKAGESWVDDFCSAVRLDFSSAVNFTDIKDFESKFCRIIQMGFGKAGFESSSQNAGDLFEDLNLWLRKQPEESIVLLIDGYDSPLISVLQNCHLFLQVRMILADFYSVIKSREPIWRFFLLSGVTRLIQSGIFGDLNICTDLSSIPKYGALLGFTDEELDIYFGRRLEAAAAALSMPQEDLRESLRDWYGGYCFEPTLRHHVYSPSSILNFLSHPDSGFINYRMERVGQSSELINFVKEHSSGSLSLSNEEIPVSMIELDSTQDIDRISDPALLAQFGLLTIGRIEGGTAFLKIPNRESGECIDHLYSK